MQRDGCAELPTEALHPRGGVVDHYAYICGCALVCGIELVYDSVGVIVPPIVAVNPSYRSLRESYEWCDTYLLTNRETIADVVGVDLRLVAPLAYIEGG